MTICVYIFNICIYGYDALFQYIIICKHCKMKLYSTYVFMCTTSSMYIFMASKHTSKDIIIYKHCKMKLYSTYVFMCTTPSMYIFMASKHTYIKRWIANYIYMIICVYIFYLCIYVYNFINVFVFSKDEQQITFI